MANPVPKLYGSATAQAKYGLVRSVRTLTDVYTYFNGEEQRNVAAPQFTDFTLPLSMLKEAGHQAWLQLFNVVQGRFYVRATGGITLTLGDTTYTGLSLTSDSIQAVVKISGLYDHAVTLRQQTNWPYEIPAAGPAYPLFKFGGATAAITAGVPFTQVSTFLTSVNENPYAPRISRAWHGFVDGFPQGYLRSWTISYPLIDDIDMLTLETYFKGKQGKFGSFTFTDPTEGLVYPNVRFDQDELSIHALAPNQNSTEVRLKQFFVPA